MGATSQWCDRRTPERRQLLFSSLSIPRSLLALLTVALCSGFVFAEADYDPSGDRYQYSSSDDSETSVLPLETVHEVTFVKMPVVRSKLEEATGDEITYSLVWICHAGDCMAVDPFRFNK